MGAGGYIGARMRIFRRGKTWWAQYRDRRFSLKVTDETAARLAFKELQRRDADPTYRPAHQAQTLQQALDAFAARQKERGRAPGTMRRYGVHASHFARVFGEHVPLGSIDAAAVDEYLTQRHAEGAARLTQWQEICTLRGALKLARRLGHYPHVIEAVIPHDFEHEYKPLERHLDWPQAQKLLAGLAEPRAAVVAFILATAADWRSVELAEPGDIDMKARTVLVRGSKNRHRWRTVPILDQFRKLAERAAAALPFEPWGNAVRDLGVACQRLGLPRVTPRDLRRSHARILRAQGVEPHLIGKMLGHADSRMVEKVYGQLAPDALATLMRARTDVTRSKTVQKSAASRRKPAKSAAS